MKASFSTLSVLLFILSAGAAPSKRDIWTPPVTYPKKGTSWSAGDTVTVTWDASNPPSRITNPTGQLLLGYLDSKGSENLDLEHPLAEDFPLSNGKVSFHVPSVPARSNYIVVLMGDSGNASPTFKINS
ncbi:hypothetical protein FA95DRAFT_1535418 [Auriscalpium vulgare]|uniref:Uncharacterized protein n=1 Tax=Auriscalpium vulgare TaxID=40419 RepID=A0ACB8S386_9AGAM|nr:hypothetical protein FA95DRAFT_1535418 [Auriscalpium vulgare]